MVHIPSAYSFNFWANAPTEVVELTCLMPNGVVIPFETNRNTTLAEIKEVTIPGEHLDLANLQDLIVYSFY